MLSLCRKLLVRGVVLQKCLGVKVKGVSCISKGPDTEYRILVNLFVALCGENHLIRNVNKTNQLIVDFRRTTNLYLITTNL